jgi:hypothetical protein
LELNLESQPSTEVAANGQWKAMERRRRRKRWENNGLAYPAGNGEAAAAAGREETPWIMVGTVVHACMHDWTLQRHDKDPFGCADKPAEKHCWLICCDRKILF